MGHLAGLLDLYALVVHGVARFSRLAPRVLTLRAAPGHDSAAAQALAESLAEKHDAVWIDQDGSHSTPEWLERWGD